MRELPGGVGVLKLAPVLAATVLLLAGCSSSSGSAGPSCDAQCQSNLVAALGTDTAVAPASTAYPPTTIQDAQALAATGAPGDIQIVRSETAPYQGCSRPNYYGIVSPNITGQALAADELDEMEQHMGLDAECPGYLFLFHTVAESTQGGYTAGAVIEDDSTLSVYTDGLGSSAAFNISY